MVLGNWPCEGGLVIRVPIPFDGTGDEIDVDLSTIQDKGSFSAAQTLFVDNHANGAPVTVIMNASYQTFEIPAGGFAYLPILQPNPPKFAFFCSSNLTVQAFFVNFFIPPVIWGPNVSGGGGGGGVQVTTVDHSGAIAAGGVPEIAIAANLGRKGFIVANPATATEELLVILNGGGPISLLPGMAYETGNSIWMGDISVQAVTAGHAWTAYEGT